MYEDKLQLVEDSDYIYLIAHRTKRNILKGNKLAKIYFSTNTNGLFSNLGDIFIDEIENINSVLGILPKVKYMKLFDIKSTKNNGDVLSCDIEIKFLDEEKDLIFLVVKQKEKNDNLIKRCVELSKIIEQDQQYFDVMQEYSKDLFFRIDIKKKTMVHRGDISNFFGLIPVVENYPESMRENGLIHADDLDGYMEFAYNLMQGIPGVYEARVQFNDRTYENYKLQGRALYDNDGKPYQMIGKSENIQKLVNIREESNKDELSCALSKSSFESLVGAMLEYAALNEKYAYILIDFDDFKSVNQQLGNIFGDFIIETAAKRIHNCVRHSDKIGRVGIDQFAVFINHVSDKNILMERAEIIQKSLNRKFNNGDHSYTIQVSIGIAFFPEDGNLYEVLHEKSYNALTQSRKRGKNIITMLSD